MKESFIANFAMKDSFMSSDTPTTPRLASLERLF